MNFVICESLNSSGIFMLCLRFPPHLHARTCPSSIQDMLPPMSRSNHDAVACHSRILHVGYQN